MKEFGEYCFDGDFRGLPADTKALAYALITEIGSLRRRVKELEAKVDAIPESSSCPA
jgi:hypothetical protein